jgi:hypothetical protein
MNLIFNQTISLISIFAVVGAVTNNARIYLIDGIPATPVSKYSQVLRSSGFDALSTSIVGVANKLGFYPNPVIDLITPYLELATRYAKITKSKMPKKYSSKIKTLNILFFFLIQSLFNRRLNSTQALK